MRRFPFKTISLEKFEVKISKLIIYLIITAFAIVYFLPFLWLVSTSLKTSSQMFSFITIQWLPNPIAWENYLRAVSSVPFFLFLKNTCFVVVFCLGGVLLSNSLIAYSFARLRWPGRDVIFVITLGTMMVPFAVTMIPTYVLFRYLGWVNTYRPLIVPIWLGAGFIIFLLRQFFINIPFELSDAARIDGCSEFGIYWRIMLPLVKPALASVAIFSITANWNDFLAPLIYLNTQDKYTLAIGLKLFSGAYDTEWGPLMAYGTLMTIPMVILFFFFARYFTRGITLTGLKR